jgi:hypothetical protein
MEHEFAVVHFDSDGTISTVPRTRKAIDSNAFAVNATVNIVWTDRKTYSGKVLFSDSKLKSSHKYWCHIIVHSFTVTLLRI